MAPVLGYWHIRGLGQPIRLLLHYVGEEYEEKLYSVGPAPEYSREDWFSVKYKLGLPFPNLPYYMDGEVMLTETKAILRYIGRRHNLLGETAAQKANVDMLLDVCADRDSKASGVFYSPDCEKLRNDFIESSKENLQSFENYGKGKTWFTGDKITIADFFLYELFQRLVGFHAPVIEDYNWIKEFIARFEALPAIKKYMASKEFKRPFNNPSATWIGK